MVNLSYIVKTCVPETSSWFLCSSCFRSLRNHSHTRVRIASSSRSFPRNVRFCSDCALSYHDAQELTNQVLRSPRMKAYKAAEWAVAIPLALVVLPTIVVLGSPVFVFRKLFGIE